MRSHRARSVTIGARQRLRARGTYTLLPGMYATLPGAYRVVQVAEQRQLRYGQEFQQPRWFAMGVAGRARHYSSTRARSSRDRCVPVAIASRSGRPYSRIDITSGTTFFRNQALCAASKLRRRCRSTAACWCSAPSTHWRSRRHQSVRARHQRSRARPGRRRRPGPDRRQQYPDHASGGAGRPVPRATSCSMPTRSASSAPSSVLIGGTAQVINGKQNITATRAQPRSHRPTRRIR